jgi:hypothetical protein
MAWWRVKYRDDQNKQHLWVVEASNEEEARMLGEIETTFALESVEMVDETKFVSPLLSKVRP